jgi:hypothetical protein
MLVSMLDPETGEVAAFEELVGSHGGLGGSQTDAFLVYPSDLAAPPLPIVGAPAVHRVLVRWLEELGLRPAEEAAPEERPRRRPAARATPAAAATPGVAAEPAVAADPGAAAAPDAAPG